MILNFSNYEDFFLKATWKACQAIETHFLEPWGNEDVIGPNKVWDCYIERKLSYGNVGMFPFSGLQKLFQYTCENIVGPIYEKYSWWIRLLCEKKRTLSSLKYTWDGNINCKISLERNFIACTRDWKNR